MEILGRVSMEFLRKCADECRNNARKCQDVGMEECARLCLACAATCHKVLAEAEPGIQLLQECADACAACATECERTNHEHCIHCAEICRKCESAYRDMIGVQLAINRNKTWQ